MKRAIWLSGLLALAACAPSPDELRALPPRLELVVPASWDKVGACLVNAYDDLQPRYVPVPSEHRAQVTLHSPGGFGPPLLYASFDLVEDGTGTKVTFRRRNLLSDNVDRDREKIEKCGRA